MNNYCYLCGKPASLPLKLKDTFTAHSNAKCPQSKMICDRCDWSINLRCFYFNPNKQKWGKLFSRNWSWLFQEKELLSPVIEGEYSEGKDTLPVVSKLASRLEIRQWLIEPPEPPFTIAIAESGQKHILFLAQEAYSKNIFPVQFELDCLLINRELFISILTNYEKLLFLGFNKTEIESGEYRSEKLMQELVEWERLEQQIEAYRGSRFFQLIGYVAIKFQG